MPHNRSGSITFPRPQPSPLAQGLSGFASALSPSNILSIMLSKKKAEIADKAALQKNKLDLANIQIKKQKLALQGAKDFGAVVSDLMSKPPGVTKLTAPVRLSAFIDPKSEEAKQLISFLVNPKPEDKAFSTKEFGDALNTPGISEILANPEFQRQFRFSPITSMQKVVDLAKSMKAAQKAPSTKGVLDRAASAEVGKPVTRFATEKEIQESSGNLVPIPSGLKLRTTPGGGLELATGTSELTPEEITSARTKARRLAEAETAGSVELAKERARAKAVSETPISPAEARFLGESLVKRPTRNQLASRGIVLPSPKVQENLLRRKGVATRLVRTTERLIHNVRGAPELLSVSGGLARTASSIAAQARGLAKLIGIDFDPGILDPRRYAKLFDRLGTVAIKSSQVRSAVVNMAFAAAISSGQTGRAVSDRDIERFTLEIGAGTANPKAFTNVLRSFILRVEEGLNIEFEVFTGKRLASLGTAVSPISKMDMKELLSLNRTLLLDSQLKEASRRFKALSQEPQL